MRPLPAIVLVLSISLAACESDADKLERLKIEEGVTSLHVWAIGKRLDSVRALGDSAKVSAYADSARRAEIAHDLAQRDLNRFMSGR